MTEKYFAHYSVFHREILEYLVATNGNTNKVYADMTFGAGGHTMALATSAEGVKVYSVDQDPDAIANGNKILAENKLENSVILIHTNFENFPKWIQENHPNQKFSGILMDLGVSSHHFDCAERGFSFRSDGELDMRMNPDSGEISAKEVIATYREEDLADIFFSYGEERYSRRIAAEIVNKRTNYPIRTTKDLENLIFHCYPKAQRFGKTHPATRVFQALRIYVNRELEVLNNTIQALYDLLDDNARLAIISFHSLEDRIVKHKFKEILQNPKNLAKIITKRPILPSEDELEENKRSRSAKLRIIEKSTMEGMNGHCKKYGQKNSNTQ